MNVYFVKFIDGSTETYIGDSVKDKGNFVHVEYEGKIVAMLSSETISSIRINAMN